MMAPAIQPGEKPSRVPIPMKATPMVAMVVQELPVSIDMNAQTQHAVSRNMGGWMWCSPVSIIIGTTPESIHVAATVPISIRIGTAGTVCRADVWSPSMSARGWNPPEAMPAISDIAAAVRSNA